MNSLPRLLPPPRPVPAGLRCTLLTNANAVWGAGFLWLGGLLLLPTVTGPRPFPKGGLVHLALAISLLGLGPGLLLLLRGLAEGARTIRLLRQGTMAQATITACKLTHDRWGRPLRMDEFRRRWPEPWLRAEIRFFSGCLALPFRPLIWLFEWQYTLGRSLGVGSFLGLAIVVAMEWPVDLESLPELLEALGWVVATTVLWIALGRGWAWLRTQIVEGIVRQQMANLTGDIPLPRPADQIEVQCAFQFEFPRGEIVRARDRAILADRVGDEPTEPVLYDPSDPRRAVLLDGLGVPVRPSPAGTWPDVGDLGPRIAFGFVALGSAWSALLAGWTVWLFFHG